MNGVSGPSTSTSTSSFATGAEGTAAPYKPTNPFAAIIAQQKTGSSASSEHGGAAPLQLHQQQQQQTEQERVQAPQGNAHKHAQARDPFELAELQGSLAQIHGSSDSPGPSGSGGASGTVRGSLRENSRVDQAAREIEKPDSPDSERGDPLQPPQSSFSTRIPPPSESQIASTTAAAIEAPGAAASNFTAGQSEARPRPSSGSPPLARYAPPLDPPPDHHPARIASSSSSNNPPPPRHPSLRAQSSSSHPPPSLSSPTSPPRPPGALPPSPTSPAGATATATASSRPLTTLPPNYHPTSVPTPGQPLLSHANQLLLYPLNTSPCPKCRGTGYKRADPMHPCRRCWERYGRGFAGVRDGRVDLRMWSLQAPLPFLGQHQHQQHHSPGPHNPPLVTYGWGPGPSGPGTVPLQAPLSPSHSGTRPPPVVRRGPPRVERSSEAHEAVDDPEGEAPPSYEAAVSTTAPLPPQRPNSSLHSQVEAERPSRPGAGDANVQGGYRPPQSGPPPQQYHGPSHDGCPGAQYHHHHHQNWQQGGPPHQQPWSGGGHHGSWAPPPPGHHSNGPGPHAMVAPAFGRPPPGALVVRPGDPRLGGAVCMKCFGEGETEGFWFGAETCTRCGGVGRVFQ